MIRTFVQICGNEVSRRSNELHATVVRLVIRPCTFEAGKEGVMNVDHPPFEISAQVIAEGSACSERGTTASIRTPR